MIVRTDAVVLHAFDYGETSRIVRLLTRQHGVIGVMARGARRPTSAFGSTLQPASYVQAVYYHRAERGLQTLKEAAHVIRWTALTRDIERVTMAMRVVEVARLLIEEGESHPLALDLTVRTLEFVETAEPDRAAIAVPWYQLRLAALLGFAPDVRRDDVLAVGDDGGRLVLQTGSIASRAGGEGVRASRAALRAFAVLARTGLDTVGRMRLAPDERRELEHLVDAFVRLQTDVTFPDRVRTVVAQIDAHLPSRPPGEP